MGRKAKDGTPKNIRIELENNKLGAYLSDLIAEEGYGKDATNVAENLMWRAIEDLISKGILTRRPGKYEK